MIYDGKQIQVQPVNLWNHDVDLEGVFNGIQFSPETRGDSVKAYDNSY